MRPSSVLVGASVIIALGLSTCGVANAGEGRSAPTPPPNHRTITDQLNDIESKLDKLLPTTTTPPTTPPTTTIPVPVPLPQPPSSPQTLGVGGVPTPSGAKSLSGAGKHTITVSGVYDCDGKDVGWIEIKGNNVTVQNCRIVANSQYGIYSEGTGNTIQNNDIKGLKPTGDGDMNAITFFGNNTKIQFNTAIDFVSEPSDAHTDFIQTWVSTSHPVASSDIVIRSNKATGPANPERSSSIPSIHQCVMVEDYKRGGNKGGSSTGMKNWLVIANVFGDSWNQCIKNDGVDNFQVTKNDFIGSSSHVMEQASGSGLKFYADNKVGTGYGDVGVPVTTGAGPD